jgi:hypothetical protein
MDEGGFAVLGIENGKLILHHVFKNFYNFLQTLKKKGGEHSAHHPLLIVWILCFKDWSFNVQNI